MVQFFSKLGHVLQPGIDSIARRSLKYELHTERGNLEGQRIHGGGGKETEMKEEGYDWRNSTRTTNDRSE